MEDSLPLSPQERSDLVAYLDGELDGDAARAVATRLTQSGEARIEAQRLEATWELLDYLPRPKAPVLLSDQTMRLVRGQSGPRESGLLVLDAPEAPHSWIRRAWPPVAVAAAGLLGFAFCRWLWPDPLERLARDFTMAQNLETYRSVGTFEFLQKLDRAGVGLPLEER
jgi:hypothetical protein